MFQKTTVEVKAIEGGTFTMATTVEQTAPAQSMTNPALPPGAEVQLRGTNQTVGTVMTTKMTVSPVR